MTFGDPVQHCNPDQIRGSLHSELGFYLGAVIDDSLVADARCFGNLRQGASHRPKAGGLLDRGVIAPSTDLMACGCSIERALERCSAQ